MMPSSYRKDLDAFKGIAVLCVVFYHLGLLKSGYLAVDLFFVINGFLIIPSVCRQIGEGNFSYFSFLKKRLIRFLPLVLLASMVCLVAGAFGMLPDHYENLGESVVASNLLSENILASLTSKNYWNALNDYKPLMHMWFLGVLAEFYVVFPLMMSVIYRITGKSEDRFKKAAPIAIAVFCAISILCWLCPFSFGINPLTAEGIRFYWFQNRFFEIGFGGLVAMNIAKFHWLNTKSWIQPCSMFALFAMIGISLATFNPDNLGSSLPVVGAAVEYGDNFLIPKQLLLILTLLLSCIVIAQDNSKNVITDFICSRKSLIFIGKMSLSIFVWHQIIIAFYRYYYTNTLTVLSVLVYLTAVILLSVLTYFFVEQKIKSSRRSWIAILAAQLITCTAGLAIYIHAGVIRDVPELDISMNQAHRNMHAEYCDRIYKYNNSFENNGKINVLVIGNSFARDMGNILLESYISDKINLSYIYTDYKLDKLNMTHVDRISQSDVIFVFSAKSSVPDYLWENLKPETKVYGIGTKNYGQSNGAIYSHRFSDHYFEQTVAANPEYDRINDQWRNEWGKQYIDFVEMSTVAPGRIRVFTPDHRFISQDCEHLTRAGAQYFASVIDLKEIFNR